MAAWTELAQAKLPSGDLLTLRHCGADFEIRLNLFELMSSRNPSSERALARVACDRFARDDLSVLIGGLGLGYTARAVLDQLGPGGSVTVAEIVPAVIEWNRGPLAALAGRPLDDQRLRTVEGDVAEVLRRMPGAFDVILMDVDNGPEAVLFPDNESLYCAEGLRLMESALRPGGVFALWAANRSPAYEALIAESSRAARITVPVHGLGRPVEHVIYMIEANEPKVIQDRTSYLREAPH